MPKEEPKTITIPFELFDAMDAFIDTLKAVVVIPLDKPIAADEVCTIKIDRHTRYRIRELNDRYSEALSIGRSSGDSAIDIARKECER